MVIIGLLSEVLVGFLLGLLVPHAGRRLDLALTTGGMLAVLAVSFWTTGLSAYHATFLLVGWLGVATGITLGKLIRLRFEKRHAKAKLTEALPKIQAFLSACDEFIHGRLTQDELDIAWHTARNSVRGFAILGGVTGLLDDLMDVSQMLAPGGLSPNEEVVWRRTVEKTQDSLSQLA